MKPKENSVPVYKLTDLMIDDPQPELYDIKSDDFNIKVNTPLVELEIFKKYFRTDCFIIFLVLEGEIRIDINLEEYCAKKNNIIIVSPNDLKRSVSTKGALVSSIAFNANFITKATDTVKNISEVFSYLTYQSLPLWTLEPKDANTLKKLLEQISYRTVDIKEHPFGKELLYTHFNILLYELGGFAKKYSIFKSTNLSRKETLVMNFVSLLQQKVKFQRNVQAYASQLNITPKYLTETVKEISGKSAGEIIDDFVIQEAKIILSDSNLSISEVAEELHFSDQSFFGKFFKRHTGISPKEYRKLD